jgi:uncharacterized protein YjeT (DUF2065 family)
LFRLLAVDTLPNEWRASATRTNLRGRTVNRTHLSLYYLAGYLLPAGTLLLLVPDFATKLLLSNRTYDDAPFRLAGILLIGLGILVVQMIRYRLEVLYPTTIVIRLLISATLIGLFLRTSDPFFLVVLAVVVVGIALTAMSYVLDRRASAAAA